MARMYLNHFEIPNPPEVVHPMTQERHSKVLEDIKSGELQERANAGDAQSQCDLGACYLEGDYVARNYTDARKWFKKASTRGGQGCIDSYFYRGAMYRDGRGVNASKEKAVNNFLFAAQRGHAHAQFAMGRLYESQYKGKKQSGV